MDSTFSQKIYLLTIHPFSFLCELSLNMFNVPFTQFHVLWLTLMITSLHVKDLYLLSSQKKRRKKKTTQLLMRTVLWAQWQLQWNDPMLVMFGSLPQRNNNESICKGSGMLAFVLYHASLPHANLISTELSLLFLLILIWGRRRGLMNGCIIPGTVTPVEVLTVQSVCCMAVCESGEPKRVLFFRRPEDPRETPI